MEQKEIDGMRSKINDIAQIFSGINFELSLITHDNAKEQLYKVESYLKEAMQKTKSMISAITTEILLSETDEIESESERMNAIDEVMEELKNVK